VLPLLSPAVWWSVRTHHAAVTHAGDSSEVGQREHMVRQGLTGKCWSEFLCLGSYLAPPRQVGEWGGLPRGMRSADTPPPTPAAGAPPAAGPWQEPNLPKLSLTMWDQRSHMCHAFISRLAATYWPEQCRATCSSACVRGEVGATGHNVRSAPSRTSHQPPVWRWAHRLAGLKKLT
jgi:hypothetical protein